MGSRQLRGGDTVALSATVSNIGPGTTTRSFSVGFQVDGVSIGTAVVPGGVGRNASTTATLNWTASPGQHTVRAIADAAGQVPETNEANNTRDQALPAVASADLIVSATAWTPAEIVVGQTVTFEATIKNVGAGDTGRSFAVNFRMDSNKIGTAPVSGGLAAGATRMAKVTWRAAAGTHSLTVIADSGNSVAESNESNNTAVYQLADIGGPDLAVTLILAPATAVSAEQIDVSWTLTNQGSYDATGSWTDQVFLSDDQTPGGDEFLGGFSFTGTIQAGQSVVRSQPVTLPLIVSGNRWIVVKADAGRNLPESDEGNNVTVDDAPISITLRDFPNLQVSAVIAPPTAFSEQTTLVEWTVTNAGTGATDASTWYDAVYLSQDQTLITTGAGIPDIFLGSTLNASFLNPGESYNNSVTVTLPRGAEGLYYLLVKTDSFSHVFELDNEDDNVGSGGRTDVQVTPPPDLRVTDASAPLATFSGQPMVLDWTVTNRGQRGTSERFWHEALYMSDDTVLDGGDSFLGSLRHSGDLETDQSYNASTTVTLPIGVSGDFFFLVRTDAFNRVYEDVFDGNNVGFDPVITTVHLTPPPDLEVELVDATAQALGSHSLTIVYRVANNGATVTPNSSWRDTFYLSATTTLDTSVALLLGRETHSGALPPEASYTSTVKLRLPTSLDGERYAVVVTDSRGGGKCSRPGSSPTT